MGAPQVALLSESAARRYLPNENPLGRTIKLGWHFDDNMQAGGVVVGIVGDVKEAGLDEPSPPEIYIPHAQIGIGNMAIVVRGAIAPSAFSQGVEAVLRDLDPDLPLSSLKTLDEMRTASVSGRRFYVTAADALCRRRAGPRGRRHLRCDVVRRHPADARNRDSHRPRRRSRPRRANDSAPRRSPRSGRPQPRAGDGRRHRPRAVQPALRAEPDRSRHSRRACACSLPRSPSWPAISPRAAPRASIRSKRFAPTDAARSARSCPGYPLRFPGLERQPRITRTTRNPNPGNLDNLGSL